MLLKRLLKKFFKAQWSPVLIPFKNGDYKTVLKDLKQQFMSVIKLKPNLYHIYWTLQKFWKERQRLTENAAATGP